MHQQAASTIQHHFKRKIVKTDYFRKIVGASIERQENVHFARYLSRILAVQNLIIYDYNASCPVHTAVPGFGGYQISEVDARVLELTQITPYAEFSSSDVMDIDSAIARIIEQGYLTRSRGNYVSVDTFPCTKADWYKYVFWPVHLAHISTEKRFKSQRMIRNLNATR